LGLAFGGPRRSAIAIFPDAHPISSPAANPSAEAFREATLFPSSGVLQSALAVIGCCDFTGQASSVIV
jgi:hypothetical protein